jgi:LysM repeat protein
MRKSRIFMCLLILTALALAACSGPSRSASTPVTVPGDTTGGEQNGDTQPTEDSGDSAPEQLATVMAGELATQTAVAAGGQDSSPVEPTEDTSAPTDEPAVEPTAEEPTPVPPTATSVPPTATPKPEANCNSPYTVQAGDWVWNIGRRCNIHPDSIIAANSLRWPYTIYPGDVLILPSNAPPFPK